MVSYPQFPTVRLASGCTEIRSGPMMFFRAVLCLAGLLLYLIVKEFSSDSTGVVVQNALKPVPPLHAEPVIPVALFPSQP